MAIRTRFLRQIVLANVQDSSIDTKRMYIGFDMEWDVDTNRRERVRCGHKTALCPLAHEVSDGSIQ